MTAGSCLMYSRNELQAQGSGEMLIELGDSWFIAKTILVVVSRISLPSRAQVLLCSEREIRFKVRQR